MKYRTPSHLIDGRPARTRMQNGPDRCDIDTNLPALNKLASPATSSLNQDSLAYHPKDPKNPKRKSQQEPRNFKWQTLFDNMIIELR